VTEGTMNRSITSNSQTVTHINSLQAWCKKMALIGHIRHSISQLCSCRRWKSLICKQVQHNRGCWSNSSIHVCFRKFPCRTAPFLAEVTEAHTWLS